MTIPHAKASFLRRHLLTCEELSVGEINALLDLADKAAENNRQINKKRDVLRGRTLINLFFEASTRTQSSFELAGKRLGADVMNMTVSTSSVSKGETLIDTATTLNAMRPDILVVRHQDCRRGRAAVAQGRLLRGQCRRRRPRTPDAGAARRAHHPPRQGPQFDGLTVAICGDILHSRVARSNINVLNKMGARVRLIAPRTLLPADGRTASASRSSPT